MDETPCYFDMCGDTTLDFVGEKNVDIVHTGNDKARLTVVLCCCLDGHWTKTMVILKGLQRVPQVPVPDNMVLAVAKGGTMNETLMLEWIDKVFMARGNYLAHAQSMLLIDSHKSHFVQPVLDAFRRLNVSVKRIPPKTTSFLQPLDVSGGPNGLFKQNMRKEWQEWMASAPKEYTVKGNIKRPSYEVILQMISRSVRNITRENVSKAFRLCGVASHGQAVPLEELNGRLRGVLGYHEGLEVVFPDDQDDPFTDGSDDDAE